MNSSPSQALAGSAIGCDVAIIGGGAAGVLVATHLLHRSAGALKIVIVEPRDALGRGVAYSTVFPEHLLNVVASRMSAFEGAPGDFVEFLRRHSAFAAAEHTTATSARFAGRAEFARYLRTRLEEAPGFEHALRWVLDRAIAVEPGERPRVRLHGGSILECRRIVLALGNAPRALPPTLTTGIEARAIRQAWDYRAIRSIGADDDVGIVGSGLSMVDVVMSLSDVGHRGQVHVLSRHGLTPLPHAAPGIQHGAGADVLAMSLRERLRWLRAAARTSMQDGNPWQWTMDGIRHNTPALWTTLDLRQQRRFLRHVSRYWDVHRHRIAPAAYARLAALRDAGRLHVHAGRVLGLARRDDRFQLHFQPRKTTQPETLVIDQLVNATGVQLDPSRSTDPLLVGLLADGIARPGLHGIGLATDGDGALLPANGVASSGIVTLGSAMIGQLWESIAIPELRQQAEAIARGLVDRLHPLHA